MNFKNGNEFYNKNSFSNLGLDLIYKLFMQNNEPKNKSCSWRLYCTVDNYFTIDVY